MQNLLFFPSYFSCLQSILSIIVRVIFLKYSSGHDFHRLKNFIDFLPSGLNSNFLNEYSGHFTVGPKLLLPL